MYNLKNPFYYLYRKNIRMKLFLLLVTSLLALQCQKKPADAEPTFPLQTDTTTVPDASNSRNSLDYLGRYQGVLPCADCEGIKTTLDLTEEFNYVMTRVYQGRDTKPFVETGTFRWDDAGSSIILTGNGETVMFKVGENRLIQLDREGKTITGALASRYILEKLSESQAVKSSTGPQPQDVSGVWKIVEIDGKSVRKTGNKENTIEFRDGRFSAYAGCNSMGGQYQQDGNKLKLSKAMSTMMACPDMSAEDALRNVLERIDDFVRNDQTLMLRASGEVIVKLELKP